MGYGLAELGFYIVVVVDNEQIICLGQITEVTPDVVDSGERRLPVDGMGYYFYCIFSFMMLSSGPWCWFYVSIPIQCRFIGIVR